VHIDFLNHLYAKLASLHDKLEQAFLSRKEKKQNLILCLLRPWTLILKIGQAQMWTQQPFAYAADVLCQKGHKLKSKL